MAERLTNYIQLVTYKWFCWTKYSRLEVLRVCILFLIWLRCQNKSLKPCPKIIFLKKAIDICYFNNKYFLILLKSCVTTLDKKNQEGHCDCLQQLHHFECVVKTKAWNHVPGQNCFRGFQEVCKDNIFEEIVVRKSFKLCQLRNPDVSDNKSASKQVFVLWHLLKTWWKNFTIDCF